jgi:hypothetical protein
MTLPLFSRTSRRQVILLPMADYFGISHYLPLQMPIFSSADGAFFHASAKLGLTAGHAARYAGHDGLRISRAITHCLMPLMLSLLKRGVDCLLICCY